MKVYVIHVSDAFAREKEIIKQLQYKNLEVLFINEGDKSDLTEAILDKYFTDDLVKVSGASSCAYKHILAYKEIVNGIDDIVMIIEDDIRFYSNFKLLHEIVEEIKNKKIYNFLLSLEDSNLKYIAKSKREKGRYIYEQEKGRLTGAYLIDKIAATNLLLHIEKTKIHIPIDWYHNFCISEKVISMYWSQPAIAVQGSLGGETKSLIEPNKYNSFRSLSFKLQRIYKKMLYRLR